MNKVFSVQDKRCETTKNYIFSALVRYTASTLHDALVIHLGRAILLARRWRVRQKLLSIQLAPVHFSMGKSPTGTFDIDGALDNFNPRTRVHQPPHQTEVAPTHDFSRPQPSYEALHGLFGHLVELD